ncbi:putative protease [Desulfitispora alkaliphila]|uniref:DUF3656 domain-containing U32 family peptidase n=1 Tax=Desulfitispora alkaliphila TaxID=622674 RepID=UPI003D1BC781
MTQKKIELLAPAGSMDAFKAAINSGADAVYIGGKQYSARKYAQNFDLDEIKEACTYAHLRGAKVYVTVNTLIDNSEMKGVLDYASKLHQCGVDSLIVQDLGLLYLLREVLPEITVQASTQMTIHNSAGVRFLEDLEVKRVVLSRELSLDQIGEISNKVEAEIECFAHGALCISYSGQCLMSSLIGGRSGNRGACAQPCRLKYKVVDNRGQEILSSEQGEHILSPKDLKTIDFIPGLIEAGVECLKFEGRMKKPEYVATVIRNYRQAVDRYYLDSEAFTVPEEQHKELKQIFNRDFSPGYLIGNPGKNLMSFGRPNNRGSLLGRIMRKNNNLGTAVVKLETELSLGDGIEVWVKRGGRIGTNIDKIMLGNKPVNSAAAGDEVELFLPKRVQVGDRIFKNHDQKLVEQAKESYTKPLFSKKVDIELNVQVKIGSPVEITARDQDGHTATVTSDFIVEEAIKRPISEQQIQEQLSRLGNTSYDLAKLDINMDQNAMVPISVLNTMRRELVQRLEEIKVDPYKNRYIDMKNRLKTIDFTSDKNSSTPKNKNLKVSVVVGDYKSAIEAINSGADMIYVGGESFKSKEAFSKKQIVESIKYCQSKGKKAILSIPRIIAEEELDRRIKYVEDVVSEITPNGISVGNVSALKLAKDLWGEIPLYGDYYLNIFNKFTVKFLEEMGVYQYTLSPELNFSQLEQFNNNGNIVAEALVYGNMTMMTSEYCPIGGVLGNESKGDKCQKLCKGKEYFLRDRMNFLFPIETDESCRSYIYNPKQLNVIDNLQELQSAGVEVLKLDLKTEHWKTVKGVVDIFRRKTENYTADSSELEQYAKYGFTKGHYFRGVL